MKVWVVGVRDCESNRVIGIYATKELATKELFEQRDKLIKEYKEAIFDLGNFTINLITKNIKQRKSPDNIIGDVEEIIDNKKDVDKYNADKPDDKKASYDSIGYAKMIENLSDNNYENWNNYPHECPYISCSDVIEAEPAEPKQVSPQEELEDKIRSAFKGIIRHVLGNEFCFVKDIITGDMLIAQMKKQEDFYTKQILALLSEETARIKADTKAQIDKLSGLLLSKGSYR